MSIDPQTFRQTLRHFASGITVVTMQGGEEVYGLTVSAFMSVSLDPPLVLVSVDQGAKAHATLQDAKRYGVSILSEDQQAISNHFAGRQVDGLETPYTYVDGFPVIEGSVASLICRVVDMHSVGDHSLFVGQVEHAAWNEREKPLLYFSGQYGHFKVPEYDRFS